MDDGTFGYVFFSLGFMVKTDVGIDRCFAEVCSVLASRDALLEFGRLA
jgi:hypothetical protein